MWDTIKDHEYSNCSSILRRRVQGQWHRLGLQQDYRRKLPQTKERHVHTGTRSIQTIKQTIHVIVKALSIENKERVLEARREQTQATYKVKSIRITPYFLIETWFPSENCPIDRLLIQKKVSRETPELNDIKHQMDLTDVYGLLIPNTKEQIHSIQQHSEFI